eukprot:TRINITY_DN2825_c0_g1_i1.p1 TRINITY_DN2825_c0_g1~~TRINITY_DN2825_c0_g1_i1.p1  ORF type:complete len:286 (+),score=61.27 TRINITY_DN2825_c0_g1_i1:87-944(+)
MRREQSGRAALLAAAAAAAAGPTGAAAASLTFFNAYPSSDTVCFSHGASNSSLTARVGPLQYKQYAESAMNATVGADWWVQADPGCTNSGSRRVYKVVAVKGGANTFGWGQCAGSWNGSSYSCAADGAAAEVLHRDGVDPGVVNGSAQLVFAQASYGAGACDVRVGPSSSSLNLVARLSFGQTVSVESTCYTLLLDGGSGYLSFECAGSAAVGTSISLSSDLCVGGSQEWLLVGNGTAQFSREIWRVPGAATCSLTCGQLLGAGAVGPSGVIIIAAAFVVLSAWW